MPKSTLIEACDRLGMYVFDEAFDAWGMGKQPGDYNQYFETDWKKDLTHFVCRDRCHPSVIIWSTGNEITERAGLGEGYLWATRLAETIRALDPSRPVSNAVCSFWNGLDKHLMEEQMRKWAEQKQSGGLQNADLGGKKDLLWEQYTEAFVNGLDIVGYNYLEGKYDQDHELFPERVIMGSENYPKEIGVHWPKIEKTPWIIGDFTWTAWDYIGEAGIGKSVILEPDDPRKPEDIMPWSFGSPYPWRTANDADFDVTGGLRPQGAYRRIVWHSGETAVFSYDPDAADRPEILTSWGFPGVEACWNWPGKEGKPVDVAVFSAAEEVEMLVNGVSVGRQKAGETEISGIPLTFRFRTVYTPGKVEAVGYICGEKVSRGCLCTTGAPAAVRLVPEADALPADGAALAYIRAEIIDAEGQIVPDAALPLTAELTGPAELLGFGSSNPVTEENYTKGAFTSWHGKALAIVRAGTEAGTVTLKVTAPGLAPAEIALPQHD